MKFIAGIVIGILLALGIVFASGYYMAKNNLFAPQSVQQANVQNPQNVQTMQNAPMPRTPLEMIEALNTLIATNPRDANNYITKAALLAQMGEHGEAIKNYNKAIDINPTDPAAYFNRAVSLFALGNFTAAKADLSTAITLNPQMAQAYHNRGVANVNLAKLRQAAMDFNTAAAVSMRNKDTAAYKQSMIAVRELNEYTKSMAIAKKAGKDTNTQQPPKALTSVKRDDDILKRNTSSLVSGLKSGPGSMVEKFKTATKDAAGGQGFDENYFNTLQDSIHKAVADKNIMQNTMPKNILDYRSDAQKHLAAGDYKAAADSFSQAIEKAPKDGSLYAERARANAMQKEPTAAIADYNNALALNPKDGTSYFERAQQKSLLGDNKGALQDAQKAQEIFEEQGNMRGQEQAQNMANLLQGKTVKTTKEDSEAQRLLAAGSNAYSQGDYKGAVQNFNELIKRQPDIPEMYYNRAIAQAAAGDDTAALKDYNAAIKRNPNLPDAHTGAASILLKQGKSDEATIHINKAIALNPDNANAYMMRAAQNMQDLTDNKATPQQQQDAQRKALDDYNKTIDLDETNAAAYFYRGMLEGKPQDIDQAQALAQQQGKKDLLQAIAQYKQQAMAQGGQE